MLGLFPAYLLQDVAGPHPNDLLLVENQLEQLLDPLARTENEVDDQIVVLQLSAIYARQQLADTDPSLPARAVFAREISHETCDSTLGDSRVREAPKCSDHPPEIWSLTISPQQIRLPQNV